MKRADIHTELTKKGWYWLVVTPEGFKMGEKTIDKQGRHQWVYYKTENAAVSAAKKFLATCR